MEKGILGLSFGFCMDHFSSFFFVLFPNLNLFSEWAPTFLLLNKKVDFFMRFFRASKEGLLTFEGI